ncbi:MAG: hypothetical protein HY815_09590 [Candidatus Riflebacteria bacterium]|nr:hypothetical protein [Candidatus Riflebacteria bacterium]
MATRARAGGRGKGGSRAAEFKEVDRLLDGPVTKASTKKIVSLLADRLKDDPGDLEALLRTARAWTQLLESETGTVLEERPEYQKALDEYGKAALEAADRAHELCPESPDAIGWHLVAYGYHSIAIGILRAFLTGAAGTYVRLANALIAADPGWRSAAGHRAMGRYYREAPWPKRDVRKAIECFRRALDLAPGRQENKLQLALALIDNGDDEEARPLLHEVAEGKPEKTESHFHEALVSMAREKLKRM